MPKALDFTEDGYFVLTIVDEKGEKRTAPAAQDLYRCNNEIASAKVAEAADIVAKWDKICDVIETWGAGRPSHRTAQAIATRLTDEVEAILKKDGPAPVTTTSPS